MERITGLDSSSSSYSSEVHYKYIVSECDCFFFVFFIFSPPSGSIFLVSDLWTPRRELSPGSIVVFLRKGGEWAPQKDTKFIARRSVTIFKYRTRVYTVYNTSKMRSHTYNHRAPLLHLLFFTTRSLGVSGTGIIILRALNGQKRIQRLRHAYLLGTPAIRIQYGILITRRPYTRVFYFRFPLGRRPSVDDPRRRGRFPIQRPNSTARIDTR